MCMLLHALIEDISWDFVTFLSSKLYLKRQFRAIIVKFRYNARFDWLKERALSEYRARSVEDGPISVFASAF